MSELIEVSYWRDQLTGNVYRQETYDDGTVVNPRPVASTDDSTEQDYYVNQGAGEAANEAWVQSGIDAVAMTDDHAV